MHESDISGVVPPNNSLSLATIQQESIAVQRPNTIDKNPTDSGSQVTFHSGPCLHREKLSKLRDEWLEKELCQQPSSFMISPSYSTADSGIVTSTYTEEASGQRGEMSKVLCIDLDEDMLIASIQNEAEASQHMVEMFASTNTMKRRRQACNQMTYRRRSDKAKQSLSSYTPIAPCHANWGQIFDDMIRELRDREKLVSVYECQQCMTGGSTDNDSIYDNDVASNMSCYGVGRLPDGHANNTNGDNMVGRPWLVSSVSGYVLSEEGGSHLHQNVEQLASAPDNVNGKSSNSSTSDYIVCDETPVTCVDTKISEKKLDSSEPVILSDTEGFWEENWSDNHIHSPASTSDNAQKLTPTSCEGCDQVAQKTHCVIKPTFCYMNQKCPSFDAISSGIVTLEEINGASSRVDNGLNGSLRSITVHRPDLASFTLPLSPIRKTESNSHVWIERGNEDFQPKVSKEYIKPSIWKRIKKLFS